MNICSCGHDEICYEGNQCPMCLMKEDRDWYESECAKLQTKIDILEQEIIALENKEKE